ncbi:MAG: transposase [Lachnospiraceae bacterium]|nr:transposase [Lachnospiraceae bacterium]
MARVPRKYLLSDINHIMLRGIGHMNLFGEDADFRHFLNALIRFKKSTGIVVYAYCLMDNHVHILIKAPPQEVPLFFKRLEVSYAMYFNSIYGHTGHLFQNRYKSEAIKDNAHFLNALRYILCNPEKAALSKWNEYPWSSAKCYFRDLDDGITDYSLPFAILGGKEGFLRFMEIQPEEEGFTLAEPEKSRKMMNDTYARMIVQRISGLENPLMLQSLGRKERDWLLYRFKQEGLTIRQLERITGINRSTVQRAKCESGDVSRDVSPGSRFHE